MEFEAQLNNLWRWASDLSHTPQKILWSAVTLLAAYLVGLVLAAFLRALASRIHGHVVSRRRKKEATPAIAAPGDKTASSDNLMIDISASIIRLLIFLGGLLTVGDIFGYYDIREARFLAISAGKALALVVGIWFFGAWLAQRLVKFGDKLEHVRADGRTLFSFLSSLIRFAALAVGLIAALQQFGFPIASLVAVIGAAGLAIALALQDTLKAVASGVVIAVFRPYRIGDFVQIAGVSGTVVDITPFTTVLNTIDNRRLYVTNDKAWANTIENSSANHLRRIDEIVPVGYQDDLDKVVDIIRRTIEADPRAHKQPPPWIKAANFTVNAVEVRYRTWCDAKDYIDFRGDLMKAIKKALDKAGVSMPHAALLGAPLPEQPKPDEAKGSQSSAC